MEMLYKIKKTLKKKNESIILDLYLKNYDKSNFYFALLFNKKIEKFKVLYVPLDVIEEKDNVEEYFCYQFVFLHTVNYILESINNNKDKFGDEKFRNRANSLMDAYYGEINLYETPENYKFTFSQFIDKEFLTLFDIVVVLFEHSPNIVSELCSKLLVDFNNNSDVLKYTNSYNYSLENDKVEDLFDKKVIRKQKYNEKDISFLENIGNRYYAMVKQQLIVIEYFSGKEIFNVSCGNLDPLGDEVYIVVKGIKNLLEKNFYRLKVTLNEDEVSNGENLTNYYLCYGMDEEAEEFKIIKNNLVDRISLDLVRREKVKILKSDILLEEKIKNYLTTKYEDKRVEEIMNSVFIKES